jgi:hypothetical protein
MTDHVPNTPQSVTMPLRLRSNKGLCFTHAKRADRGTRWNCEVDD